MHGEHLRPKLLVPTHAVKIFDAGSMEIVILVSLPGELEPVAAKVINIR
jgi:hypothetical protein